MDNPAYTKGFMILQPDISKYFYIPILSENFSLLHLNQMGKAVSSGWGPFV